MKYQSLNACLKFSFISPLETWSAPYNVEGKITRNHYVTFKGM